MVRSHRAIPILVLLFVGLYFLTQGYFWGHGYYFGDFNFVKLIIVGAIIYAVLSATSGRRRRSNCYDDDLGDEYSSDLYSDRIRKKYRRYKANYDEDIRQQLNKLHIELDELKSRNRRRSSSSVDEKIDALTDRIVVLEKIVTDRGYQVNEEISKL